MQDKKKFPDDVQRHLDEANEMALSADVEVHIPVGVEGGLVGMMTNKDCNLVPVFDYNRSIDYLAKDNGWTRDEAKDWIDYNTTESFQFTDKNQHDLSPVMVHLFDDVATDVASLIPDKFDNPYLRDLAIMDHINETKLIHDAYVRMKNSVPPGQCSGKSKQEIDALQVHMQAELCDLYLLLAKHFKNSPLVDARSRKFYEKSGEQYLYDDGDAE